MVKSGQLRVNMPPNKAKYGKYIIENIDQIRQNMGKNSILGPNKNK